MANRSTGRGLCRIDGVRTSAADRRDEQRGQRWAAERRHRRLERRDGELAVDVAARRHAEHRGPVHAGDPVTTVLVDTGAIGSPGQAAEVEEHAFVPGLAGVDVVVVGPHRVAVGVGPVHRPAIGREREAVRDADAGSRHRASAVGVDPIQRTRRLFGRGRIEHRTYPEAPGWVAPSVVHPIAAALRFQVDPVLPLATRPVEEAEASLDRDEEAAWGRGQREGPRAAGRRPDLVDAGGWVEPMDRPAIDVLPVQARFGRAPERALAELCPSWEGDGRGLGRLPGHAGSATRSRKKATLSTASAFGPSPSGGSDLSDTSCSRTYQPR